MSHLEAVGHHSRLEHVFKSDWITSAQWRIFRQAYYTEGCTIRIAVSTDSLPVSKFFQHSQNLNQVSEVSTIKTGHETPSNVYSVKLVQRTPLKFFIIKQYVHAK